MFAQIINNKVVGLFARPQPDVEGVIEIEDNDSRIVEFNQPSILQQIINLENSISERRKREALLGDTLAIAFIQDIENQIIQLRNQL